MPTPTRVAPVNGGALDASASRVDRFGFASPTTAVHLAGFSGFLAVTVVVLAEIGVELPVAVLPEPAPLDQGVAPRAVLGPLACGHDWRGHRLISLPGTVRG